MLETAATTEMQSHFACAHAHRAEAFRVAAAMLLRLGRLPLSGQAKGPRPAARPLEACACA